MNKFYLDLADQYSLGRLASLIDATYDAEIRQAYIENWLARAETIASSPRLDAAEWHKRLEHNRRRWGFAKQLASSNSVAK